MVIPLLTDITSSSLVDLLPESDPFVIRAEVNLLLSSTTEVLHLIEGEGTAIAFSGGIDSCILASFLSGSQCKSSLLTLGRADSADFSSVMKRDLPKKESFNFITKKLESIEIEKAADEVSRVVSVCNFSHFEDCVAFWLLGKAAVASKNIDLIVSANGPDELFCGYDKFRRIVDSGGYRAAEAEIESSLKLAEKLSHEVSKVVSEFGLKIREPFLQESFKVNCRAIPIEHKILIGNDRLRKRIWRCLGISLDLPKSIIMRPKKAMQYGMGIHSVLLSMLRRNILKVDFEQTIS